MTAEELKAQAAALGFTDAQYKALTAVQRIAFLHAAAQAKQANMTARMLLEAISTQRIQRKRMIVGGNAPLEGEAL